MSSNSKVVIAFDLYGTLLSTESIAEKLSEKFGKDRGPQLASKWRLYQLEYTWRLNSMSEYRSPLQKLESHTDPHSDQYEPFSTVTEHALRHTLSEASLSLSEAEIKDFMKAYDSLSTFPDVSPALSKLADMDDITAVVFSNGTKSMITNSVHESEDLKPHASVFKDLVHVEEIKKFKPHPDVYAHLAKKVGKEGKMGDMWLVSGNPFDVVGARSVGMQSAWVDRGGLGWTDALVAGENGKPTVVVKGLGEVIDAVKKHGSR